MWSISASEEVYDSALGDAGAGGLWGEEGARGSPGAGDVAGDGGVMNGEGDRGGAALRVVAGGVEVVGDGGGLAAGDVVGAGASCQEV